MCGIFGYNFSDRKLAKDIMRVLHHRGPNHASVFEDKDITLGYTRLSIIDLKTGNQPIYNEDRTMLVFFNGEIYNYMELKQTLQKKGHRFLTDTDTEVIIHSYEEFGKSCLSRFNGMFAFVIYDMKTKELFMARDRLGVKPLYYYHHSHVFIFASEMKAILEHEEVKRQINYRALDNYFGFRYCPGEETIISGIKKLMPGHYLIYKNNVITVKKYWDISYSQKKQDIQSSSEQFLALFEDSVRKRMISDVPIGALLSGGIDSSSIVAMMSRNSENAINTYTLGFDEGIENEFSHARLISEKFSTNHREYTIDSGYVRLLPEIVWHMDEPVADPTAIPNYVLSEKASKHVKVIINGDGADELFAGYEQYKIMKLRSVYDKIPKPLTAIIKAPLRIFPDEPFFTKLQDFLDPADGKIQEDIDHQKKAKAKDIGASDSGTLSSYLELISVMGRKERRQLFNKESMSKITDSDSECILKPLFEKADTPLDRLLSCDFHTFLPDNMLLKYDRITMAKSAEGRVPFCDYRIAEFAASLPEKFKLNFMTDKYILRYSMKNILPRQIVKRKKQRFFVPTDNWMKKDFGDLATRLIEDNSNVIRQYFNPGFIKKIRASQNMLSDRLLKMNRLSGLYYSRQLWTITNFLLWHEIFMENKMPPGIN